MNTRELTLGTLLLFSSMGALADVFTYEVASGYTFGGGGVFGSAAIIDLSFNNGNTSNLNQLYTYGNLTDISVRSAGGAFLMNDSFSSPSSTSYSSGFNPSVALLSTNSTGNGLLTIVNAPTQSVMFFDPTISSNTVMFTMGSSNESIYLTNAPPGGGYNMAQIFNGYAPITLSATYLPSAVPIPAAVWLFGLGLSCVLFTWRKQTIE